MALTQARLRNMSTDDVVEVTFNPSDYEIDSNIHYTELNAPGLQLPILQFVRGETQQLQIELFLDGTNKRSGIEADLKKLRDFITIKGDAHTPPICQFEWGDKDFYFRGVVTSLRERFQMFAEDGKVLRARVAMTLKKYKTADEQLRDIKKSSPDRTHVRVMRENETLAQIAYEAYGDPRLWKVIAEANDIDRPRFVPPGTPLKVPSST